MVQGNIDAVLGKLVETKVGPKVKYTFAGDTKYLDVTPQVLGLGVTYDCDVVAYVDEQGAVLNVQKTTLRKL